MQRTRPQLALTILLVASAAFYAVFIARTSFRVDGRPFFTLVDDAMISMRYAQHLAQGQGLVWNIGEAPIQGFTNPGWMLVMALLHVVRFPAEQHFAGRHDASRPRSCSPTSSWCSASAWRSTPTARRRAAPGRSRHGLLLPAGLLVASRNGSRIACAADGSGRAGCPAGQGQCTLDRRWAWACCYPRPLLVRLDAIAAGGRHPGLPFRWQARRSHAWRGYLRPSWQPR